MQLQNAEDDIQLGLGCHPLHLCLEVTCKFAAVNGEIWGEGSVMTPEEISNFESTILGSLVRKNAFPRTSTAQ